MSVVSDDDITHSIVDNGIIFNDTFNSHSYFFRRNDVQPGLSADNVAASLACARLAARVVHRIEEALDCNFSKDTFKYSRLISHVHYMLLRIERGEKVAIDINDYVAKNFPGASTLAQDICTFVACEMKKTVSQEELTLLALHIQRVM